MLDIHTGGSYYKNYYTNYKNDKHMPFVMNMVIMCFIHHASTEMVGENLQPMLKSKTIDTNPAYPIKYLQDVKYLMCIQAEFIQL